MKHIVMFATLGCTITLIAACGDGRSAERLTPFAQSSATPSPSMRIEDRIGGPPGDEGDTGPVHVVVPNCPADPGPAETYGPFRLLPWCYGDTSDSTPRTEPTCESPDVALDDQSVLRNSNLYVDEALIYVPAGLAYAPPSSDYMCGRDVRDIVWKFGIDGIQVSRSATDASFDVRVPPWDSYLVLEKGSVGDAPAVFLRSKVGGGSQYIYVISRGILTQITGNGVDFGELRKVAESFR